MIRIFKASSFLALALALLAFLVAPALWAQSPAQTGAAPPQNPPPPASAPATTGENTQAPPPDSGDSRGKKLILKDGSFQIVREYQRIGDRVRYYSIERSEWDEIPAAMVDWDATARAASSEQKQSQALLTKVAHEQKEYDATLPLDIDASVPIAPGVFLPPGEGMFMVQGKTVIPLEQVATQEKRDKKQFLKQVLVPVPIVPGKENVEIPGPHAKQRISSDVVEFYLREAPPDPNRVSPIRKSSRPGESGPEVELVRATVKGKNRVLESISSMFGEQLSEDRNTLSLQTWAIAQNLFRFTLGEPLQPGEYALAEILPDGMNLFVWDFGVDKRPEESSTKK
jgi:hypothetical protein